MASESRLIDPAFEQTITLRDAYRIMEKFVDNYRARGDTLVSDFLFVYATVLQNGLTTDPAAAGDFLEAARGVLDAREDKRAR